MLAGLIFQFWIGIVVPVPRRVRLIKLASKCQLDLPFNDSYRIVSILLFFYNRTNIIIDGTTNKKLFQLLNRIPLDHFLAFSLP